MRVSNKTELGTNLSIEIDISELLVFILSS